jgi:hypothetical protein
MKWLDIFRRPLANKLECELRDCINEWTSIANKNEASWYAAMGRIGALEAENKKLRAALEACAPSWLPPGIRDQRREALKETAD